MPNPARTGLCTSLAAGLMALTVAVPAYAEAGRFVLQPTDSGFVRMDTSTGDMSTCHQQDEQVVCTMAADERAAFQDTLDELEARVALLERRLNMSAPDAIARDGLPDPHDFERGMDRMEQFMRRFMGMLEDFENDGRL